MTSYRGNPRVPNTKSGGMRKLAARDGISAYSMHPKVTKPFGKSRTGPMKSGSGKLPRSGRSTPIFR